MPEKSNPTKIRPITTGGLWYLVGAVLFVCMIPTFLLTMTIGAVVRWWMEREYY